MNKSIYLINPAEGIPGYSGFEVFGGWGGERKVMLADLATTTVAALLPGDWTATICDERAMPVDLHPAADVIGITGKISQRNRMVWLADHYRAQGKLVVIGGPYASLNPDDVRPHCDILMRGEMEEVADTLFNDIAGRRWQPEYEGGKPDLRLSPLPRWDLYPRGIALAAQVQTSRGCPFECEFCDVIQYLGRKQRQKPPEQVIAELRQLHRLGYRGAFLADDNFTVYRRHARAVLTALRDWNQTLGRDRMGFGTQVSIDVARDEEILPLLQQAGFELVYIGIESPSEDSLSEVKKRQNLRLDLVEEVNRIVSYGIGVQAGIIVGFDSDDAGIFERQRAFIQRLPVLHATVGILVAPAQTPLHARLAAEGRLLGDDRQAAANPLHTNVIPKRMTRAELAEGTRWLCNQLYNPEAFLERVFNLARAWPKVAYAPREFTMPPAFRAVFQKLRAKGPAERELLRQMQQLVVERPELFPPIRSGLIYYSQVRYMYETTGIWEPGLAREPQPVLLRA